MNINYKNYLFTLIALVGLASSAFGIFYLSSNLRKVPEAETKKPEVAPVIEVKKEISKLRPAFKNSDKITKSDTSKCDTTTSLEKYEAKSEVDKQIGASLQFLDSSKKFTPYPAITNKIPYSSVENIKKARLILDYNENFVQSVDNKSVNNPVGVLFSYNNTSPNCWVLTSPFIDSSIDKNIDLEFKLDNVEQTRSNIFLGKDKGLGFQVLARRGDYFIKLEIEPMVLKAGESQFYDSCAIKFPIQSEQIKCIGDQLMINNKAELYSRIKAGIDLFSFE